MDRRVKDGKAADCGIGAGGIRTDGIEELGVPRRRQRLSHYRVKKKRGKVMEILDNIYQLKRIIKILKMYNVYHFK